MQTFLELAMKTFADLKVLAFGVWGLKTSLGQFGPEGFGKKTYQAISWEA